jgi:cytoplasmic iron level regulating protein YaaA (DUF328/UPF0246 family)
MAFVFSPSAREKFKLLMSAQQEPMVKELVPASKEEIKQIKELRKTGLSYVRIAEIVGRSESFCHTAVKRKHI